MGYLRLPVAKRNTTQKDLQEPAADSSCFWNAENALSTPSSEILRWLEIVAAQLTTMRDWLECTLT